MFNFAAMVNRMLMLFILIGLGILFAKLGFMNEKVRRFLSELVTKVLVPGSVLTALMVESVTKSQMTGFLIALAAGFGVEIFSYFFAMFVYRKKPPEENVILRYAIICPNAAFMGIPIVSGIYGPEALLYVAALLIPVNVFMFFFGLRLFLPKEGPRPATWKQLLHPSILAVVVGFVLMVTGLRPPEFITETIVALGSCTTPVSMILIGGILATVNPKAIFSRRNFAYSGLRLAVVPLVTLAVMVLLRAPAMVTGATVLIFGMPGAVATAALATNYGKDAGFASEIVFLSTVLSLVSLPLLALLQNVVLQV